MCGMRLVKNMRLELLDLDFQPGFFFFGACGGDFLEFWVSEYMMK